MAPTRQTQLDRIHDSVALPRRARFTHGDRHAHRARLAPFLLIAGLGALVGVVIVLKLKPLTGHLEAAVHRHPLRHLWKTATTPRYTSRDGITDAGLAHFQAAYPTETISKEDLFYYIYGLLHSEDYKAKYADNLTKELPRIPAVKQAADFWHFSTAGRELAELHVNYETQAKYAVTLDCGSRKLAELQDKDFYVTKMKFASKGDKSTVVYNHAITLKGIPLAAYDYVVNGKPALEWVMERQGVSTHKDSGIVNDANDWAVETVKNANDVAVDVNSRPGSAAERGGLAQLADARWRPLLGTAPIATPGVRWHTSFLTQAARYGRK